MDTSKVKLTKLFREMEQAMIEDDQREEFRLRDKILRACGKHAIYLRREDGYWHVIYQEPPLYRENTVWLNIVAYPPPPVRRPDPPVMEIEGFEMRPQSVKK